MRREYENKDKFPDGLIFYAPLNVEGDLSDHIQGLTPTITAKTTCEWDSTYNGYRVRPKTYSSSMGADKYNTGIIYNVDTTPIIETGAITCFYELIQYTMLQYSSSQKMCRIELVRPNDTQFMLVPNQNWPKSEITATGKSLYVACTYKLDEDNINHSAYYLNGENKITGTGSAATTYPDSIRMFLNDQDDGRSGNTYHYDGVFKNVMIFNRILSQSEIQQLIQILRS